MYRCTHCHCEVDFDDAGSITEDSHCLCRRCFATLRGEPPVAFGRLINEDLTLSLYAGETGDAKTVTDGLASDWPEGRTKADLERFLREAGEGLQPA